MKIMRQSKCGGFTLVELMGAVVISMIVILLLYKIFDKVQTVFVVSPVSYTHLTLPTILRV